MATEKKISVASWRLPKKVNFGPWDAELFFNDVCFFAFLIKNHLKVINHHHLLHPHHHWNKTRRSCVLRASVVECQSILSINTLNGHLYRYSIDIPINGQSTLNGQLIKSRLINSPRPSVNRLICIVRLSNEMAMKC